MGKTFARVLYVSSLFFVLSLATGAFAQFTQGNLVVAVSGCGIYGGGSGGTCNPVGGTGGTTGTGNGTYGDDQAAPWTLFQFECPGGCTTPTSLGTTYVNALSLPTVTSGANLPISNDYGSQSEGTLQLSGDGVYLTMLGIGINAADFNVYPSLYCENYTGSTVGLCDPENGNPAAAQSVSLTGYSVTAVPRVAALIDANGNVNTSTVLYNIYDQNDPRSAYLPSSSGTNIYVSGQGCKTCTNTGINPNLGWYDNTAGVYYTAVGATNNSPTAITGPDNGPSGCTTTSTPACDSSISTRMIQIVSPIGTGTVNVTHATSSNVTYETGNEFLQGITSITINGTTYSGSNVTYVSATKLTVSPEPSAQTGVAFSYASPATLYVSLDDKPGGSGGGNGTSGYNRSYVGTLGSPAATSLYTCTSVGGGCPTSDGPYGPSLLTGFGNTGGTGKETITTGSTFNGNSLNAGLAVNLSPQNFFFASPSVLYVTDTGSPKNTSNGPDTVCTNDGGKSSATVGDGGLQKWINSVSNGTGTWSLAYTLYNGLNLTLNADCDPSSPQAPGATNAATGLYGLAGVVNNGVATLYVTSYPNDDLVQSYLWGIQDTLATTSMTSPGTAFTLLETAPAGSLFRGVSFAPSAPTNGQVEITSVPSGLTISTSGTGCNPGTITAPLTETWTPTSSCTLSVTSPQTVNGAQYTFSQWETNGAASGSSTSLAVTAPSGTATYTANFTTQYQLTTSATSGGSVSSGGYYTPGADATITATASAGNCFVNFTGAQEGYPPVPTTTSNPLTLQMNSPESITANFGATGITSPASGSIFTSNAATFSWSACGNASAYYLDLGPMEGSNTYLDSGDLSSSTTSYSVTSLPTNGSTVWARFYTEVNGTWSYIDSSYTAYNSSAPPSGDGTATLTSPTGSTLPDSSVTFSWSAGTSAVAYWLDVGTSSQANYYYSSGSLPTTTTSETVSGLPTNGSLVVVTVYTQFSSGGTWYANTYNFNALNSAADEAQLTSPTGPSLPDSIVTFDWSTGTGAYAYWLDVGTTSQANYYYSSGSLATSTLSETVSGLPTTGGEVVVTLYTQFTSGGTWYPLTYDFNALNASADQATLTSPTAGTTLPGSSEQFTWSAGTGAYAYWLDVGTTSQANYYYSSGSLSTSTLSETVSDLPTDGSTVVVTVYTQFTSGGPWYANTYDFTAQ